MKASGPLYLTPLRSFQPDKAIWYAITPVGVNTINNYMKSIAKVAGLNTTGKRLTNHIVSKTTVQKLKKHGVPNNQIAAITGHRNEQSLQEYFEMETRDHQRSARILSGAPHVQPRQPLQNRNPNLTPSIPTPAVPQHQYNFSDCTVFFGNTQASSTSTQIQVPFTTRK